MNFSRSFRPVIMGRNGMVASGHALASLSGLKALQEGGNAVDAALAAAFTVAVVKPEASGPGGDLFALVFMRKTGKVEALNASGPAPKEATIELFREKGLSKIPTDGPLSIAIPGAVDGWFELHRRYGTKDLSRLASDAITLAREGFPVSRRLLEVIEELGALYPAVAANFRRLLGDGSPGKTLLQKSLADTLEEIARRGRDAFYTGSIARQMCASVQAEGGILSEEDLQGKFAEWLEPLKTTYRSYTVFEQPPVSQGFMVLEMLNILEGYALEQMEPADVIHVMVEAKKMAFEDRIRHLEDPRFGDPQIERLISKPHAEKRRGLISGKARPRELIATDLGGDTTYLCVVDREGNVVSLIQSIFAPFGSRVVAGDTGVVMNNRLSSLLLDPSKANALKPGKRPAHTLNSYMVFREGEFLLVGGSPGADDQPQTNLQVLHNLLDRRMDPQSAVEAPRFSHSPGTPPRAEGPEELRLEEGYCSDVISALKQKGHNVKVVDRFSFGSAKVIVKDPATGTFMAGADPRREALAIGW